MDMPFVVIESSVRGKWDDASRCEDVIVTTEHFAAVIDGATARQPDQQIAGLSPGRFAALVGKAAFEALPPTSTAAEAVLAMSHSLTLALNEAAISSGRQPEAIFGFVAYSSARREIWRVAACYFLWAGYLNTPRLEAERVPIEARSMLLQCLALSGANPEDLRAHDPSTQVIAPLIKAHANIRNRPGTPWSFGAIDGRPVPSEFIEVFAVPGHIEEVVLASDGWPELRPTLAESESVLARVLRDDPLMIRVSPATKGVAPGAISFDDRAYLRLMIK
jgi:hypothetical protein